MGTIVHDTGSPLLLRDWAIHAVWRDAYIGEEGGRRGNPHWPPPRSSVEGRSAGAEVLAAWRIVVIMVLPLNF